MQCDQDGEAAADGVQHVHHEPGRGGPHRGHHRHAHLIRRLHRGQRPGWEHTHTTFSIGLNYRERSPGLNNFPEC